MYYNPLAKIPSLNWTSDGEMYHQDIITMWIGFFLSIVAVFFVYLVWKQLGKLNNMNIV